MVFLWGGSIYYPKHWFGHSAGISWRLPINELYYPKDGHRTPAGHQEAIAEILADEIIELGLTGLKGV